MPRQQVALYDPTKHAGRNLGKKWRAIFEAAREGFKAETAEIPIAQRAYGMCGSMSHKGNCGDTAPTESFFNSLKNERVHATRYRTHQEAKADLFEYIEVFYNRSRRHSSLGWVSPEQFLRDWIRAQQTERLAA